MKPIFYMDTALAVLMGMKATRLRTVLSVLGVSFGVAAVMAVLSIGQGGEARVKMELNDIGINRAWLYPDKNASRGFKMDDAKWLAERLDNAIIEAHSERYAEISGGSTHTTTMIIGCEWQLPQMESTGFRNGRFFTKWEEDNARPTVVLESRLAEKLFGDRSPVGQKILINGLQCNVIGEVTKSNTVTDDGACYVPITTYNKWFSESTIDQISISAPSQSALKSIKVKASKLLEVRTGGVEVVTLETEAKVANNILGTFKMVILCVAVVALIVGGIGIMNMMFMSVNERVREIGIRKALGARRNQILLHFMLEAMFLALCGGILGIVCGVLLALAASALASVPFIMPLYAPAIGVGFSAGVGLLFGLAPATRAAKMSPIDALRN
jgi:putative ABC transport system permease protein